MWSTSEPDLSENVVNFIVHKVTHNNLKGGDHLKVGKRSSDYTSGGLV